MSKLDILLKCITLLYREHLLGENITDNSKDLVKTVINQIKQDGRKLIGGDTEIISELVLLTQDLINSPDGHDKSTLLQSLSLILKDKLSIYNVIERAIDTEMEIPGLKRSVLSLRINLNNYYKQNELKNVLGKAAYQLKLDNVTEDIGEFVSKLIVNLEALANTTKAKDPGIVDEIDINEEDSILSAVNKVKEQSTDGGRIRTGWLELNEMLGGGLRFSECVLTSALPHNYKSGFIQSLFCQVCMFNKPRPTKDNKKPLNVFISLEDDADVVTGFMYKYLYYSENGKNPDLNVVSGQEIAAYIRTRLTSTGFNIKLIRANPSEWSYKHIFNKILEYEASGYEIQMLFVDYLFMLPTTGCMTTGPMGTDVRDLLNRMRNFCSSKGILFATPAQLSTEAKQLIRNGVSPKDFVKEIAGKGYYERSKQLDQTVDLEIYQHIAKVGKKYYLTFQRGKRRYPEIIDDEKKYFMLPFPDKAPIPPNLKMKEDGSLEYIGFSYSKEDSLAEVAGDNDGFDF